MHILLTKSSNIYETKTNRTEKRKNNKLKIVSKDFHILPSITNTSRRPKTIKDIDDLNNAIN